MAQTAIGWHQWAQKLILGINVQGDVGPLTVYTSKRRKIVYFDRAPALQPASPAQTHFRNLWRGYARDWQALTPSQRQDWQRLASLSGARCTGINLYFWNRYNPRPTVMATLQRQSGVYL